MDSIRARLFAGLVLVGLTTVGTFGIAIGFTINQEFARFIGVQRERSQLATRLLRELTQIDMTASDRQTAAEAFAQGFGYDVEVRDSAGAIVARATGSDKPAAFIVLPAINPPSLVRFEIVGEAGAVAIPSGEVTLVESVPVRRGGPPTAAEGFLQTVYGAMAIALLAFTGIITAIGLALGRSIVRPVEALTAASQLVREGKLDARVAVRSSDEIGRLGLVFNSMAADLQKAEYLRRSYIADIAHELRSPTANLLGYLEGMRDGVFAADEALLSSLHEEAASLTRLVADLQALALADAGRLHLDLIQVQMKDLIEQSVGLASAFALAKGVTVRTSLAEALPELVVDPQRIGQVIRNLLTNALTHTPTGGAITLSARNGPEGVTISVTDTGVGIASEHLPFVFERFYRADPSRSRATGGSGLGLAISKQVIEAHGGEITVRSTEGEGTTVSFVLPRPV